MVGARPEMVIAGWSCCISACVAGSGGPPIAEMGMATGPVAFVSTVMVS